MNRKLLAASLVVAALGVGGIVAKGSLATTSTGNQVQVHYDILVSDSIESMAARSPVIIRGEVSKALTSWNLARNLDDPTKEADEIRPGTNYEITNVRYLRGSGPSTVVLTLLGGTYKGVTEEMRQDVQVGKEYVLFLSPIGLGMQGYIMSATPGRFLIQGDMAIPGIAQGVRHPVQALTVEELAKRIERAPLPTPSEPEPAPTAPSTLPGHADLQSGKR